MKDLYSRFTEANVRQCYKHDLAGKGESCEEFAKSLVDSMSNSEFLERLSREMSDMFGDFESDLEQSFESRGFGG